MVSWSHGWERQSWDLDSWKLSMLACCRKGQVNVITWASFYVEHVGNEFPALEQHVP